MNETVEPYSASEELLRLAHQTKTDLAAAHAEICKLQGIDPSAASWPAWSSPAHTIAWCDRIIGVVPEGWVPCSPEWLDAGGDCANAPRVWNEGHKNHFHPPVELAAGRVKHQASKATS
jgi:hypothetical protein